MASCSSKNSNVLAFPEIKDPVDVERYGAVYELDWLGEETIQTVVFSAPVESGITISDELIDVNIVSGLFSGGNIGTWWIDITITTETRTKNRRVRLTVKDI